MVTSVQIHRLWEDLSLTLKVWVLNGHIPLELHHLRFHVHWAFCYPLKSYLCCNSFSSANFVEPATRTRVWIIILPSKDKAGLWSSDKEFFSWPFFAVIVSLSSLKSIIIQVVNVGIFILSNPTCPFDRIWSGKKGFFIIYFIIILLFLIVIPRSLDHCNN